MTDDDGEQPLTDPAALRRDLAEVLNRHCAENSSNTPDQVLAQHLMDSLFALNNTINRRSDWYGRHDQPGAPRLDLAGTAVALLTPPTPISTWCASCGTDLDDDGHYCQRCGATREPVATALVEHATTESRAEFDELRLRGQPPGKCRPYDITVRSDDVEGPDAGDMRWAQLENVARLALGLRTGDGGSFSPWADVTVERRHVATTRRETPWEPVPVEDLAARGAERD